MKKCYFYWDRFDPINVIDCEIISTLLLENEEVILVVDEKGQESLEHRLKMINILLSEFKFDNLVRVISESELSKFDFVDKEIKVVGDKTIDDLKKAFSGLEVNFELLQKPFIGFELTESNFNINKLVGLEFLSINLIDYISENHLYYIKPLIGLLSPHRLSHSISVARTAFSIIEANYLNKEERCFKEGLLPLDGYRAGIIHDIGKSLPIEKQKELMEKYHKEYVDYPTWTYHQFIAEELTKKFYIVTNKIIDGVKYHSTGSDTMSLLGEIIYASDKIEPTRDYDSSYMINRCQDSFDKSFPFVVKEVKEFLESKGMIIDNELSEKFFNKYL